jgi:hypothetical protein
LGWTSKKIAQREFALLVILGERCRPTVTWGTTLKSAPVLAFASAGRECVFALMVLAGQNATGGRALF